MDISDLSAVSENKVRSEEDKVELMPESGDETVFDSKHKMPVGSLCQTSVKYRNVPSQNIGVLTT